MQAQAPWTEGTPLPWKLEMAGDTLIDPAPSEVTKVASGVALGAPSSAPPPTRDARREIRRCVECQQQFSGEAMFCPFDGTKLATASWDPSKDSMLGKTVDGRYKLLSVLGEGGMGTVYEVQHTALNRSFAMKVLRRDVARDHELADRFTQEAKATAAVKHPNIVAITDFGRLDDETPYFVMELLSGETLADLIKRCGPLSPPRAARIVQQLAAGLRAAHEAGVVHRDLKPENVFLVGTPTAAPDAADDVRIVDFGAAKVAGAARLTKVGVVFGTPHYMSPEQASGQAVDHRADIYALGVIMYVMFTARVPFEADTYMGILTQHMFVQPTPPSRLLPDAGHALGALETVTLRALEKRPDDRYQSMEELAVAIERVVTVGPDGGVAIAPRVEGPSRRPPGLFATRETRETRESDDLDVGARPSQIGIGSPWRWPVIVVGALGLGVGGVCLITWMRSRPAPVVSTTMAPVESAVLQPTPAAPRSGTALSQPPASSTSPLPSPAVRITSTPSFAEVWSHGVRVGTTPFDVVAADAPGGRYTLRAAGYDDRVVAGDPRQGPEVHVDLVAKPVPPTPPRPLPGPAAPPHRSGLGDLGDPWATK
jgi:serine/threonine protein kinase